MFFKKLLSIVMIFLLSLEVVDTLTCYNGFTTTISKVKCKAKHCKTEEFDLSKVHPKMRIGLEAGIAFGSHRASCDTEKFCLKADMLVGARNFTGKEISDAGLLEGYSFTDEEYATTTETLEELIAADSDDDRKMQLVTFKQMSYNVECCSTDLCNTFTLPIKGASKAVFRNEL